MRFKYECFAYLPQSSFCIDSAWFRHFAETRLCALPLSILTMSIYLSYLPCPRQLSRYSSHATNGKLASFRAASCWCGVIWIWRHQRHSTACDGRDSASHGHLLAFYDQFIKDYRQVPAHWCFYERTCEREVGYKRLMIVCSAACCETAPLTRRWWRHFYSWCCEQLRWSCERDAAADRYLPSVTSPYTENYTGDTEYTAETLFKLKCLIKRIY